MKRTTGEGERGRHRAGWRATGIALLGLVGNSAGCSFLQDAFVPDRESLAVLPVVRSENFTAAPAPPWANLGEAASASTAAPPQTRWGDPPAGPTPGSGVVQVGYTPAPGASARPLPAGSREQPGGDKPAVGGTTKDEEYQVQREPAGPRRGLDTPAIPPPAAVRPVTLPAVLALAGVENPQIAIAQQAVQASLADQLQARALLLPSINVGTNYHLHNGNLQTSFGAIRKVDRQSLYLGLGARTVAAETVTIPGIWLLAQLGEAIYEPQIAGRVVAQRQSEAVATRNNILLDVALRYLALLGGEGRLAVILQSEADFGEVVKLMDAYVKAGTGKKSDLDRARTDLLQLQVDEQTAQEEVAVAAAELSRFLNLDPSVRLQIANDPIQVVQLVDPHVPLPDLMQVAIRTRPELRAAAAAIGASQARLNEERARPFLPMLSVGMSAGGFGGWTVSHPSFNNFATRSDFDAIAFWTLQNMGLGNVAQIRRRRSEVLQAEGERNLVLNRVGREVVDAYNLSAARLREVDVARRQVQTAVEAFQRDLIRIRGFVGRGGLPKEFLPEVGMPPRALQAPRPIEVLTSARLLVEARQALLRAIIGFDESQFRLFVALGQPPTLAVAGAEDGDGAPCP